jgi:hypothetical protein
MSNVVATTTNTIPPFYDSVPNLFSRKSAKAQVSPLEGSVLV